MTEFRDFEPGNQLPAWFLDRLQDFLSGLSNIAVRVKPTDGTMLQVPAGPDPVSIPIDGKWRYVTASVERSSPGGAARDLDVFVTSADDAFSTTNVDLGAGAVPVEQDDTDRSFALAIVEVGATPAGVALSRRVAVAHWDGSAFTDVSPVVGSAAAAQGERWAPGDMKLSVLSTPDPGWLKVQGQAVTAAMAPRLRARLLTDGAPHGTDASGNPLLPEAGRALVIMGQGAGLTNRALGAKFGEETHDLSIAEMPAHAHSGTTGTENSSLSHGHTLNIANHNVGQTSGWLFPIGDNVWGKNKPTGFAASSPPYEAVSTGANFSYTEGVHTHPGSSANASSPAPHDHNFATTSMGGGGAHNNMQPSVAVSVFVKT